MAQEEEKPQQPAEGAPKDGKRKRSLATLTIFGGVMLVEGLAIFLCMKMFGSNPDPTEGVEGIVAAASQPWSETEEIEIASLRVQNNSGSRTLLYSILVVVSVHKSNSEELQEFLKSRKSTIEDALSRIIRSAEQKHLAEPGLETLKRQFRFELNELIGDETIIENVLIPECMPLSTGF